MNFFKSTKISQFKLKKVKTNIIQKKITSSKDAANYAKKFYFEDIEIFESFFILLLNRNNITIGYAKISQGGVSGTIIDNKLIAKYAIDSLAEGVIIMHNHPSGNKVPSHIDINATNKIKEVLKICDSHLIDHLILTKEDYYSFADNGKL